MYIIVFTRSSNFYYQQSTLLVATREDASTESTESATGIALHTENATSESTPTAQPSTLSEHSLEELRGAYESLLQQAKAYRSWKARYDDVQARFDAARAAEPKVWSVIGLLGMERKTVLLDWGDGGLSFVGEEEIQAVYAALRQQLERLCADLEQREAWEQLYEAGTLLESWAAFV